MMNEETLTTGMAIAALQQRRGRHNSLRPFTGQDYDDYENLIRQAAMQTKMNKSWRDKENSKPVWLQARDIMKHWQNELAKSQEVPRGRKPGVHIERLNNYLGILEAVENARDRRQEPAPTPRTLAETALARAKFSSYERVWIKLVLDAENKDNPNSCTKFLHFRDVPWPLFTVPEGEETFPQGRKEIFDFILHPDRIGPDKDHGEALREARALWDCDTIYDRLLSRIIPQDLGAVFIAYRRVWKAVGGLEDNLKSPTTAGFPLH